MELLCALVALGRRASPQKLSSGRMPAASGAGLGERRSTSLTGGGS